MNISSGLSKFLKEWELLSINYNQVSGFDYKMEEDICEYNQLE